MTTHHRLLEWTADVVINDRRRIGINKHTRKQFGVILIDVCDTATAVLDAGGLRIGERSARIVSGRSLRSVQVKNLLGNIDRQEHGVCDEAEWKINQSQRNSKSGKTDRVLLGPKDCEVQAGTAVDLRRATLMRVVPVTLFAKGIDER